MDTRTQGKMCHKYLRIYYMFGPPKSDPTFLLWLSPSASRANICCSAICETLYIYIYICVCVWLICTHFCYFLTMFHSSPRNTAYMRQWAGSSLVHVMACRLFQPVSNSVAVKRTIKGIKLQILNCFCVTGGSIRYIHFPMRVSNSVGLANMEIYNTLYDIW